MLQNANSGHVTTAEVFTETASRGVCTDEALQQFDLNAEDFVASGGLHLCSMLLNTECPSDAVVYCVYLTL